MSVQHQVYMQRCLQLALLGNTAAAPNPMVGAVLVHNHTIIGEGYHRQYGQAHAEVNCIASVLQHHKHLISSSILYVSLEPCNHYGNTPPCTQAILTSGIRTVVVGCTDASSKVNGMGIATLRQHGVQVITGILEQECVALNAPFFYSSLHKLPYITLKWAQSSDGYIANAYKQPINISNVYTSRYTHKLRATHQAIWVGANTVLYDDPLLNNRYYGTQQPIRIVWDKGLTLPTTSKLLSTMQPTWVFNTIKSQSLSHQLQYIKVEDDYNWVHSILTHLYHVHIHTILVEGGSSLHYTLLQHNFWCKLIVITNTTLTLQQGYAAPHTHLLPTAAQLMYMANDSIAIYHNQKL